VYWQFKGDDWLAPLHQQATWQRSFRWPWETLFDATVRAYRYLGEANGGYWLLDWLLVVPVVAAAVYVTARYRPAYALYVAAGILIPLCYVFEPRPLMSMPRFVLPLFPAFWAIAEVLRRFRVPRLAVVGVSAALLGVLTLLFVNWYYVF
jgi:predicted benzoate:H+ symporter BenE